MIFISILIGLAASPLAALASSGVCARSAQMVQALETATLKPCEAIDSDDLARVGYLSFARQSDPLALVSTDFSGLAQLTVLDLDGVSLKNIPADLLSQASSLEYLYLGSTDLTAIPPGFFAGLRSLKLLDLENTPVSALHAADFQDLGALQILTLTDAGLASVDAGAMDALQSLAILYIGHTLNLKTLPSGMLDGLPELNAAYFIASGLAELPGDLFAADRSLTQVWFSEIPATQVPVSLFSGLPALRSIHLESVPLNAANASDLKATYGSKVFQ